jgi:2-polyprenyl-6-methoxyphenol hydroxylase-like FAD-dependent oxidoreductase
MEWMRMVDVNGSEEAVLNLTTVRGVLQGRFISLARTDLAAAIFGACNGIPAKFGVSVTGIEQKESGVAVTLSDGRRETFDLVVGADGPALANSRAGFRPGSSV